MTRHGDDKRGSYFVRDAPVDVVSRRPSPRPPAPSRTTTPPAIPRPAPVPAEAVAPLEPEATARSSGFRRKPGAEPDFRVESVRVPDYDAVSQLPPVQSPTAMQQADAIVQELMASPPGDESIYLSRLLRLGHVGLRALRDHFPGPLWYDPRRPHSRLPRARQLSAIASCLVSWGEEAVPYVASLLEAPHPDVRLFAAVVARDMPYPGILEPLARLSLAIEPTSRRVALEVLPDLAHLPGYPSILAGIRTLIRDSSSPQQFRMRAVQGAEVLRDALAVPELVQLLGDGDRELARSSLSALRRLTAHDFGTMRFGWNRWLKAYAERPRIVWLMDGLTDRRAELRSLAAEELARLTGHARYLSPDAPRDEAMRLRAYYERYWEQASRYLDPGAGKRR